MNIFVWEGSTSAPDSAEAESRAALLRGLMLASLGRPAPQTRAPPPAPRAPPQPAPQPEQPLTATAPPAAAQPLPRAKPQPRTKVLFHFYLNYAVDMTVKPPTHETTKRDYKLRTRFIIDLYGGGKI